jgi:hypothetical protein
MFSLGFKKIAFVSKHTKEKLIKSTPKEKGGKDGKSSYFLRFHPKEKRWSCTCPDWQIRRRWLGKEHKKHHDCKHIKAHLSRTSVWKTKEKMRKYPKEVLESLREERSSK